VVEAKQRTSGSAAGSNPPPPSAPAPISRRRLITNPANDNAPTPLSRIARAAVFVAVGGAIAWALHLVFG